MPILDVRWVGPAARREGLAGRIADAAAKVFRSGPQQTWVFVRFVEASDYAENAGGPPEGVSPVLVSVLKKEIPAAGDELEREARALTEAVARACGRPAESVHVVYEPPAAGRISFGGKLAR